MFEKEEWESKGMESVDLAQEELKDTLEGLAKHLFGDVEMRRGRSRSLYFIHSTNSLLPQPRVGTTEGARVTFTDQGQDVGGAGWKD